MSLANYDHLLDPPDDCYCAEHESAQPCRACTVEAAEMWAEARRKGELPWMER